MPEVRKDDGPGLGDVHVDAPLGQKRKPRDRKGVEIAKSDPQPLYVYRQLLNAPEVIKWAKGQGFKTCLPPEDMHVTVLYSKTAVDWMAMGEDFSFSEDGKLTVQPGGPRVLSQFGGGAVVLEFACSWLTYRHESMIENGASSDYPDYKAHITLSYAPPDGLDLSKVEPYRGELVFGPEIFEPISEGGFDPSTIVEKKVSTYFKVSGVNEGLGLVFGWGIVCTKNGQPYTDTQGNHIPDAAMVEATTDFMKNSRAAGDMHAKLQKGGTIVHSFPLTAEIAKAMGISSDQTGWMVAMSPEPAVLKKFASGEYTGFSIGGEHIEINGKPVEA